MTLTNHLYICPICGKQIFFTAYRDIHRFLGHQDLRESSNSSPVGSRSYGLSSEILRDVAMVVATART